MRRYIFILLLFFVIVRSGFAGNFDPEYIAKVNRSHIIFNSLRLACSVTLFSSVPYFLAFQPFDPVTRNAAYVVFTPSLVLVSLSYGSWIHQDAMLYYRTPSREPLISFHNAMDIMRREVEWSRPLGSLGVNTLLLIMGGLFLNIGNAQSLDWKSQLVYSAGLGLTIHSSVMVSLDVAEILVRLIRKEKARQAWIMLNI